LDTSTLQPHQPTLTAPQAREVLSYRTASSAPELLLTAALTQSWGAAAASDDPQQPEGYTLLPSGLAGDRSVVLQQGSAWGVPIGDPFRWQPAAAGRRAAQQQEGQSQQQQQQQQQQAQGQAATQWAELQVQQLHASCAQLLRGVAPFDSAAPLACSSSVVNCTADGRPLLACHPGVDAGRVVLCCAASGSSAFGPGSSSAGGYQLSPVLAKLAADVVRTGGAASSTGGGSGSSAEAAGGSGSASAALPDSSVLRALGLYQSRQGLQGNDGSGGSSSSSASTSGSTGGLLVAGVDSWEGLPALQAAAAVSQVQQEEAADLARDAERGLAGLQQ
jgi:hypothetical protein